MIILLRDFGYLTVQDLMIKPNQVLCEAVNEDGVKKIWTNSNKV